MKSSVAFIAAIAALAAFATTAANAADPDKPYTKEQFKSDAKTAGTGVKDGVKDSAVDVGHQVGGGTKKAYHADKAKIKKDVKDGKPGDGSLAKKNDSLPAVTEGRKTN